MRKLTLPMIATLVLVLSGCSETTTPAEKKKEPEKPAEPATGQSALYKMYQVARSWAPDAQVLKMNTIPLSEVPSVPNGTGAAWQATFTSAQPVHNNIIRVNERDLSAGVAPTGPSVVPQQRSVLGAGGEARVRPTTQFSARPVVAKTAPPPPPVPFTRQQQAIQANGGRPISVAQQRQMEPQTTTRPNVRIAPPAREVVPQNGRRNAVENRTNQPNQTNPPANVNPGNQGNPSNRPNQVNRVKNTS